MRAWMGLAALLLSQGAGAANPESCNNGLVLGPVRAQPQVIVVSAPSGGGKNTLASLLLKDFSRLELAVSTTTRAPRPGEKDGVDYRFISREEFQAKMARHEFAEQMEYSGNFYGTDAKKIQEALDRGHSVLALVDVRGAEALRRAFNGRIFTLFVRPPDLATLEKRLRGRGTESEEAIQKRLKQAAVELEQTGAYDYVLVNDHLERAHQELVTLARKKNLIPE